MVVDIKYSSINKDYVFFQVETSDKYIKGGALFLDLDDVSFVKSIVFEQGKRFFVMAKNGDVSRSGMAKALNEYEDGDSLSIVQLKAEELSENILVQLFMNSIANPTDEVCSYNNLSGKLLCYRPTWLNRDDGGMLWGLDCLEIRIGSDMCVHMSAHRMTSIRLKNRMKFEQRKIQEYPQYEFSYNNHTLKRVTGDKLNDKNNLIQKPIEGERGGVTFFDFKDYDTFSCTKNGVLYDICNLMREQYAQYLTLSFKEYNIDECLEYSRSELETYKAVVESKLYDVGIVVIDEVKSSTSEAYLQDFCEGLTELFPSVRCGLRKRLAKSKVNIRYIHEKAFYNEGDPHQDDLQGYAVQHITVENFNRKAKAAVYNVLKELVIKKDIQDKRISIVDWPTYKYASDWIFGAVIGGEYYFMNIHPDGTFDIEKMKRNLFNMSEYDTYMDYFGLDQASGTDYNGVIGLIKDSSGNVNLIKDTNMYTLPEFGKIGDVLKNVSMQATFSGKDIIELLRGTMNASDKAKIKAELDILIPKLDPQIAYSKEQVMSLLTGMGTKKAVVKYVYENTGVMLYAYMRGEESRHEFLSGSTDINYFKICDVKARFCIGEIGSGMKYTIERASVVREVEAVDGSQLIFKELLPLMGVEFARYGMLTVMPFPFKYIREFATAYRE